MFENFSFTKSPPPPFYHRPTTPPLSPYDSPPPKSLSAHLTLLSITPPPPQALIPSPPHSAVSSPTTPSADAQPCVRFQRQILARLQTTDAQMRCLERLVSDVVSRGGSFGGLGDGADGSKVGRGGRRMSLPNSAGALVAKKCGKGSISEKCSGGGTGVGKRKGVVGGVGKKRTRKNFRGGSVGESE